MEKHHIRQNIKSSTVIKDLTPYQITSLLSAALNGTSNMDTVPTQSHSEDVTDSLVRNTPTDLSTDANGAGEILKGLTPHQITSLLLAAHNLTNNMHTVPVQSHSKQDQMYPPMSKNTSTDLSTDANGAGETFKDLPHTVSSDEKENDYSTPSKKRRRPKKQPKPKINDGWIHIGNFSLEEEAYKKLITNGRVQHYHMTSYLNKTYPDIPCILSSYGKYGRTYERFTLRYKCTHAHEDIRDCHRLYKVFQIVDNEFEVYRNDKDVTHNTESKVVGTVRGEHRREVSALIAEVGVEEYLAQCTKNANPELTRQGNLQDCVSLFSAEKMKNEFIQSQDFDKDAIVDLVLMKLAQDCVDKDPQDIANYIRRVSVDPFFVTMFSDEQLKAIRLLEEFFTVYIDATGSVVKFGEKKIFYYAGVTPDTSTKLGPKERHRVLPLFECLSSAHDSFNIGILLSEVKIEFHKMFPTSQWPIRHAVTDFSFALLNAICWSWNQTKLINYINCLYDALTSNTPLSELQHPLISTFLHICCCHLIKNFSKDVKEYYPTMDSEQQNILKEIFAGMFGVTELKTLEKIWTNLSKILLSKHTDDEVELALRQLCEIMVPEEELLSAHMFHDDHEGDSEIEKLFPVEKITTTDEYNSMYKNSRFYQHFKSLMATESFAKNDTPNNSFYSPTFAKMFLQKYISVLPLWTCFERKANSYAEGHFKDTKKNMISKQSLYGAPPLKPGRFIKLIKGRVINVVNAMKEGIPRYRNTGRKRKAKTNDDGPVTKRTKKDSIADLKSFIASDSSPNAIVPKSTLMSDLYKRFRPRTQNRKRTPSPSIPARTPSPSVPTLTPSTSKRKRATGRTPSPSTQIDDLHVEEQWNRKPKKKFSHFNKTSLAKVQKSPTAMKKLFEKTSKKSSQRSGNTKKLPNHLVDHPETYLASQESIIVARMNTKRLSVDNYRTLTGCNVLSSKVVDYIIQMMIKEVDDENIKFEMTTDGFHFNLLKEWQEENHISLFVNTLNLRSTLVIIDWRKNLFFYVDPLQYHSAECDDIFSSFEKCIDRNERCVSKQFKKKHEKHHIVMEEIDSVVAVMNIIDQYLKKGSINDSFTTVEYRLELQHRILRSSTQMQSACVVCGKLTKLSMVKCDCCDRWTHCHCINQSEEDLKEDTIHYFCIICVANTPRSELHEDFKMVPKDSSLAVIPEESFLSNDTNMNIKNKVLTSSDVSNIGNTNMDEESDSST